MACDEALPFPSAPAARPHPSLGRRPRKSSVKRSRAESPIHPDRRIEPGARLWEFERGLTDVLAAHPGITAAAIEDTYLAGGGRNVVTLKVLSRYAGVALAKLAPAGLEGVLLTPGTINSRIGIVGKLGSVQNISHI